MDQSKNRIKTVLLRFSESEYQQLRATAGDVIFAKWCREILLGSEVTPSKAIQKAKPVDPELLKELNRISTNVNQIAKVLNTAKMLEQQLKQSDVLKLLLTFENINEFIRRAVTNDYEAVEK